MEFGTPEHLETFGSASYTFAVAIEGDRQQVLEFKDVEMDLPFHQGPVTLILLVTDEQLTDSNNPRVEKSYSRGTVVHVRDMETGISAYLTKLEQADCERSKVLDELADYEWYSNFAETLSGQTTRERRITLVDELEGIARSNPTADAYLDQGKFRSSAELTDKEERLVEEVFEAATVRPGVCHETALSGFLNVPEDFDNEVFNYGEGVMMPRDSTTILSTHSWLEIHGKVVEMTLPWHRFTPPEDAIYFGISVDLSEPMEMLLERGRFSPMLMPTEVYNQALTQYGG